MERVLFLSLIAGILYVDVAMDTQRRVKRGLIQSCTKCLEEQNQNGSSYSEGELLGQKSTRTHRRTQSVPNTSKIPWSIGDRATETASSTTPVIRYKRKGQCGQPHFPMKRQRILGGDVANPHSHPWMISLRYKSSNKHYCGAVLIRAREDLEESDVALTSIECAMTYGAVAVLRGHYISGRQEVRIDVEGFYPYSNPNDDDAMNNDIAIAKLSQSIPFSSYTQPACLPETGEGVIGGSAGIVTGWGRYSNDKRFSGYSQFLREVQLVVVSEHICAREYAIGGTFHSELMFCVMHSDKDFCTGDEGGPFMKKIHGNYVLMGIASDGTGCVQKNIPSKFTRVSHYMQNGWIQETVRKVSSLYPHGGIQRSGIS